MKQNKHKLTAVEVVVTNLTIDLKQTNVTKCVVQSCPWNGPSRNAHNITLKYENYAIMEHSLIKKKKRL